MVEDRAPSELVNAAEIARRLGISSERVRQLAKAGTIPPPTGVVGRNKVWQWRLVEAWAVATGRLQAPPGETFRRPPSIWIDTTRQPTQRVVDDVVDAGRAGLVHVRIWQSEDGSGRPAVLLGQLEDSEGSLTNWIEHATQVVIDRWLGARGIDADWFEYLPPNEISGGELDVVTFEVAAPKRLRRRQSTTTLVDPAWYDTTHSQLEQFLGAPLELYEEGTYTSRNVRSFASSGGNPVEMEWDPEGLLKDLRAAEYLLELVVMEPGNKIWDTALQCLARRTVGKRQTITAAVESQGNGGPVVKVNPEVDEDLWSELATRNERPSGLDHDAEFDLLTDLRRWLLRNDVEMSLRLRPGAEGRLAWRRPGETAVLSLETDSLEVVSVSTAIRHVEHVLAWQLREECPSVRARDVACSVPSEPIDVHDPLCAQYLDTVAWWGPATGDEAWAEQLRKALDSDTGRLGYDPWGRLVLVGKRSFVVDWPTQVASKDLPSNSRVLANPGIAGRPVFVSLPDGRLDLLAAKPGTSYAPEFTWGYSGHGPSNLAWALEELLVETNYWEPKDRAAESEGFTRLHRYVAAVQGPLDVELEDVVAAVKGTT